MCEGENFGSFGFSPDCKRFRVREDLPPFPVRVRTVPGVGVDRAYPDRRPYTEVVVGLRFRFPRRRQGRVDS